MSRVARTSRNMPSLAGMEELLGKGEPGAARAELDRVAVAGSGDAQLVHDVAQFYMHLGDPARAAMYYADAVSRAPDCMPWCYDYSTALMALGRLGEAETLMDRVIAADPDDHDAWYNRATLRRQTPERNHVESIQKQLARADLSVAGAVPLYYALAKELEDLERDAESFAALRRGATARRSRLAYDVKQDVAMMQSIARTHDAAALTSAESGYADVQPVFVMGLPRCGTTLVDRIMSAHGDIDSHGEGPWFAQALTREAGSVDGKQNLLAKSLQLPPDDLGRAYARWASMPDNGRLTLDKTPANFLYLGLIARALPNARMVYVRRQPMDACYAIYKTLFRRAYPYSYDLSDLAEYWLSFDALMQHWQAILPPEKLLVVDYEQLVTDPDTQIQRMLDHVGVSWQDTCRHFETNPAPTLTASAAQVRQPLHASSVGKWRRHADDLAPLAAHLSRAGVAINPETRHA